MSKRSGPRRPLRRAPSTDRVRADIDVGLQTTLRVSEPGTHTVRCGGMGRCEILLACAQRLSRPQIALSSQQLATRVLRHGQERGSFVLHPLLPPGFYNPAFFQGTSGIGYMLLRLAYPRRLPSVLLWE